jgi:WD40 repeat protein
VVSASADGTVRVWDSEEARRPEPSTLAGHAGEVARCQISPDGAAIVSASHDNTLKVWDTTDGTELDTLRGHTDWVEDCAISPDGSFIVSVSADGTVKIWDAADGSVRLTRGGHESRVIGCAISPDGSSIVSVGTDNAIRVWDTADGAERARLEAREYDEPRACAISPDGRLIISASTWSSLRLWDLAEETEIDVLEPGAAGPDDLDSDEEEVEIPMDAQHHLRARVSLAPDGASIVSAGAFDRTITIWDTETRAEHASLDGHQDFVYDVAVSPDGALIASVSRDATLRVWEAAGGAELAMIPLPGRPGCVAAHPFLPRLACGDAGGALYLIDLVGIEYGPLVVTAVDRGGATKVRCPACWSEHPVQDGWLGLEIACPGPACTTRLRVNSFVAGPPHRSSASRGGAARLGGLFRKRQ